MKLKDLLLEYLYEQVDHHVHHDPDDENELNGNDFPPEDDENEPLPNEDLMGDQPEVNPEEPEPVADMGPGDDTPRPEPGLSRVYKAVIERWKRENPQLTDAVAENAVRFFDARKAGFRGLKPAPARNIPEIYAFSIAYPNFFSRNFESDTRKLKEISSYTWEQMEFLMDRFFHTDDQISYNFKIEGDTFETQMASALSKWDTDYNKIIDEDFERSPGNVGRVIVHRIDCKEDAQYFGKLQNLLAGEYGVHTWCVTRMEGNMWTNYRPSRAFYFIYDPTHPINSLYRITAIQSLERGKFGITNRADAPMWEDKSWGEIEELWPVLRGKKDMFPWFGTTKKEVVSAKLDNITFVPGHQYDFVTIRPQLQREWVESNRAINSPRAFLALSENYGPNHEDLQTLYVNKTEFENYKERFKSNDGDKFGMLKALKPYDYKRLDSKIKHWGVKMGINAIKHFILSENFTPIRIDSKTTTSVNQNGKEVEETKTIILYKDKTSHSIGVMDLSNLEWIQNISNNYTEGKTNLLVIPNQGVYVLQKFQSSNNSDDYFYFGYPQANLIVHKDDPNPQKMKGNYCSAQKGDELMEKYKPFSWKK